MPTLRLTDRGPAALECRTCGTAHRDGISCPPANRWLIAGTPVPGLANMKEVGARG